MDYEIGQFMKESDSLNEAHKNRHGSYHFGTRTIFVQALQDIITIITIITPSIAKTYSGTRLRKRAIWLSAWTVYLCSNQRVMDKVQYTSDMWYCKPSRNTYYSYNDILICQKNR